MEGNFGFIHEKIEIKVLILYIMRRLPGPVTFDVMTGFAVCDDGISYFDFTESVAELVATEHLRLEDNHYSLTNKGKRNGEITESSLPYSVRAKAEAKAVELRSSQSRNSLVKTSRAANAEGGYIVNLSLSDGIGDIAALQLFAANEQQAKALEAAFRKNAESIYGALIEMILK